MQIIISILALLGTAALMITLSGMDIPAVVKGVIIAAAVLLAIYSMARIQPKASESERRVEKANRAAGKAQAEPSGAGPLA